MTAIKGSVAKLVDLGSMPALLQMLIFSRVLGNILMDPHDAIGSFFGFHNVEGNINES